MKESSVLGTFKLTGIPPSARGVPQIKVSFDVDANGILTVVAHDKDSGNSESIVITSEKNQLTKSDIERMVYDAKTFSQSDQEARARSIALNTLQEQIAIKRAELDLFDLDAQGSTQTLLDQHSHWAESSGELASLTELNSRIEEVGQMCADREGLIIKAPTHVPAHVPGTSLYDVPPASAQLISATSPSEPIFRRKEL